MAVVEKRYAEALLESATTKEENASFQEGLVDISKLFKSNEEFRRVLLDPRIGNNIKLEVIEEIFPEYKSKTFKNFLSLLIEKGRIGVIGDISKEYSKINDLINNELTVQIMSATTLTDAEVAKISDKYKKIYNAQKVRPVVSVDEKLLGGVKVIVGNKVYDGSLKTQLQKMF